MPDRKAATEFFREFHRIPARIPSPRAGCFFDIVGVGDGCRGLPYAMLPAMFSAEFCQSGGLAERIDCVFQPQLLVEWLMG